MSARRGTVVVIGDALLDRDLEGTAERVSPEGPVPVVDEPREDARPGGAALAAALAARDGWPVTLVTALAPDAAGVELRGMLAHLGIEVVDAGLDGRTPEKVRIRAHGQTIVRLDRGSVPGATGGLPPAGARAIAGAAAVLVSDYGRGLVARRDVRAALQALPASVPIVWDPHPRGPDPVRGTLVVTPNRAEARAFAPGTGPDDGVAGAEGAARALIERWGAANVCITLAAEGALLVGGPAGPLAVPAPLRTTGDASGAGDRFASRVACLLAEGALLADAVAAAVAPASEFVAAGGASRAALEHPRPMLHRRNEPPEALAERVRRGGGTVVATGGCFDLLHAGHVRMLEAARALGDSLIVCLNSDASVARLKGPGRPVVGERDRAAVLSALACVDAVALFDEPTPETVLERLRPHLFAKGGDYRLEQLPEARALERWGGRAVILPYVAGRSTSRMIVEAAAVAG